MWWIAEMTLPNPLMAASDPFRNLALGRELPPESAGCRIVPAKKAQSVLNLLCLHLFEAVVGNLRSRTHEIRFDIYGASIRQCRRPCAFHSIIFY